MSNLKQITLFFEYKNNAFNVLYRFYLISENGNYEYKQIGTNGFSETKKFEKKKDALMYIDNEIESFKSFFNIK